MPAVELVLHEGAAAPHEQQDAEHGHQHDGGERQALLGPPAALGGKQVHRQGALADGVERRPDGGEEPRLVRLEELARRLEASGGERQKVAVAERR